MVFFCAGLSHQLTNYVICCIELNWFMLGFVDKAEHLMNECS